MRYSQLGTCQTRHVPTRHRVKSSQHITISALVKLATLTRQLGTLNKSTRHSPSEACDKTRYWFRFHSNFIKRYFITPVILVKYNIQCRVFGKTHTFLIYTKQCGHLKLRSIVIRKRALARTDIQDRLLNDTQQTR